MGIELFFAADFGGLETMKGCLYAHPLYKGNCDKFTFSEVPRRQRSMRGGRTEKKPAVQDAGTFHNLVCLYAACLLWLFEK